MYIRRYVHVRVCACVYVLKKLDSATGMHSLTSLTDRPKPKAQATPALAACVVAMTDVCVSVCVCVCVCVCVVNGLIRLAKCRRGGGRGGSGSYRPLL